MPLPSDREALTEGRGRAVPAPAPPALSQGTDVSILGVPSRSISGNSLAWKRLLCLATSAQQAYPFRAATSLL